MKLNWDCMQIVKLLSDSGSINHASQRTGLNPATLSRQLDRAERQLGVRIFVRTPQGLIPTEPGKYVLRYAREIDEMTVNLLRELPVVNTSSEGTIRLAVPFDFFEYGLDESVARFINEFPEIKVDLKAETQLSDLYRLEADVLISALPPNDGVWGKHLVESNFGYFCSAELMDNWAIAIENAPEDAALPLISNSKYPDVGSRDFLKLFPKAREVALGNEHNVIIPLVKRGIGFARLPFVAANKSGRLKLLREEELIKSRSVWMLTLPAMRKVPRIAKFFNFVEEEFATRRPLWEEFLH